MMRFCSLGSGSTGNATLVSTPTTEECFLVGTPKLELHDEAPALRR